MTWQQHPSEIGTMAVANLLLHPLSRGHAALLHIYAIHASWTKFQKGERGPASRPTVGRCVSQHGSSCVAAEPKRSIYKAGAAFVVALMNAPELGSLNS